MSSNPNLPVGLALVAGAAAYGLASSLANVSSGGGIALGALVGGVTFLVLGQKSEEKEKVTEAKKPKDKSKKSKKTGHTTAPTAAPTPAPTQAPSSPDSPAKKPKKKSKKPETKAEAPKSPAPPAKAKSPQKSPSAEPDQKQELTKTQLQKIKKRQKKETEEKAKADEKAAEAKREADAAKKAARKAEKKKKDVAVVQSVQNHSEEEPAQEEEEELGEGWEKPSKRNTFRVSKGPKDSKKGANKSREIPEKKTPAVTSEIRVPIPKHGSIIGPGGEILKVLQDKTGAKVTMPKKKSGSTSVVIEGDAQAVKEAEQAIRDIVLKGYSPVTHSGYVSTEINLDHPDHVGRVAGPKGQYLRDIQRLTGASLNLPEKNSGKTLISIYGKPDEIGKAKIAINELLNQGWTEYTHPGWAAEEYDFPSENLGRLIGPGGERIQELCQEFKVRIDTPKKTDLKQNIIVFKGHRDNIERAKEAVAKIASEQPEAEEPPQPDPEDPWQEVPTEAEW